MILCFDGPFKKWPHIMTKYDKHTVIARSPPQSQSVLGHCGNAVCQFMFIEFGSTNTQLLFSCNRDATEAIESQTFRFFVYYPHTGDIFHIDLAPT